MAFQPGQTGNPGGRPKDKPFRDALRLAIADAGEDQKALRRVASALLEQAYAGEIPAIKEIADRLDGKVPQAVIGGDDDENPIKLAQKIEHIIVRPANRDG